MDILNGVKNFLQLVNDNWTTIIIIIGLVIGLYQKIKNFKIDSAKGSIRAAILEMITRAEKDYSDWVKAGEIKRYQVIKEIFDEYPILYKVADQESLIKWIDDDINNALKTLRKIVEENKE